MSKFVLRVLKLHDMIGHLQVLEWVVLSVVLIARKTVRVCGYDASLKHVDINLGLIPSIHEILVNHV